MEVITSPLVDEKFAAYPATVRTKMKALRDLILAAARENNVSKLIETLKWNEPSYLAKGGSSIRIDWKSKQPEYCGVYFICSTNLISTFRILYEDAFVFEGNRAILLPVDSPLPEKELKKCFTLAFTYHKLKDLLLLGE